MVLKVKERNMILILIFERKFSKIHQSPFTRGDGENVLTQQNKTPWLTSQHFNITYI